MSRYTECRSAAFRLLEDPSIRPITEGPEGIFTDLDVIFLAARGAGGYDDIEQMKDAHFQASEAMGRLFRDREVVRFGPVYLTPKHPDYMRIASKIVYAAPEGPAEVHTPNGTFPRLFVYEDAISRQGRRLGANRDDLKPWDTQDILKSSRAVARTVDERRVQQLLTENTALRTQLVEATTELQRLREHAADTVGRSEFNALKDAVKNRKTARS